MASRWQLFIRHAHREVDDRSLDNGLSRKGREQGERLAALMQSLPPSQRPQRVLSSPKLRCVQTAEYVASVAGVQVESDERLLEQDGASESDSDFHERVQAFFEAEKRSSRICYVSHGDLLPLILRLLEKRGLFEVKKGDGFWVKNGHIEGLNTLQSSGKRL